MDLGAFSGDTIEAFYRGEICALPVAPEEFTIFAFEPNPRFEKALIEKTKKYSNLAFSNGAAWIENGKIEFSCDPSPTLPYGSSVMKNKEKWKDGQIIEADCFDFSEWIKQFKDDYVVVKMDIEGAEFPILNKMLDDGTVEIMNELYCEFHPNKVRDFTTTDKILLIEKLNQLTKVFDWH